jgi:hypothetical protein
MNRVASFAGFARAYGGDDVGACEARDGRSVVSIINAACDY